MEESDGEINLAFYLFANHHWAPSFFNSMSSREKALVAEFVKQEIKNYKLNLKKELNNNILEVKKEVRILLFQDRLRCTYVDA